MQLSDRIFSALTYTMETKFGTDRGNKKLFAEYLGVSTANVSRWLRRKVSTIEMPIWNLIEPKLLYPPEIPEKDMEIANKMRSLFQDLEPGRQLIAGVINVCGVPDEKIRTAIAESDLTQEQKNALILKIFS